MPDPGSRRQKLVHVDDLELTRRLDAEDGDLVAAGVDGGEGTARSQLSCSEALGGVAVPRRRLPPDRERAEAGDRGLAAPSGVTVLNPARPCSTPVVWLSSPQSAARRRRMRSGDGARGGDGTRGGEHDTTPGDAQTPAKPAAAPAAGSFGCRPQVTRRAKRSVVLCSVPGHLLASVRGRFRGLRHRLRTPDFMHGR